MAFGAEHLGTFDATSIGDEPSLNQQGVTLTGVGTWSSQANSGTMTVSTDTAPSLDKPGRVSGSLDVKVTSGGATADVSGSWTCLKTLAGGDGWSSA